MAVIPRSAWRARDPKRYWPRRPKTLYIVLHHTAGTNAYLSYEQEVAYCQQMQNFHMNTRGWYDIGQHYTVMRSGRVFEGVPDWAVGTHVAGYNSSSIGIETQGTFLDGARPSAEQIAALGELCALLRQRYSLPADAITYHRRFNPTQCPGSLVEYIPALAEVDSIDGRRGELMSSKDFYGNSGEYLCYVGRVRPDYTRGILQFQGAWFNAYAADGPARVVIWWEVSGKRVSAEHILDLKPGEKKGVDLYWLAGTRPLDGVVRWQATADVAVQIDRNVVQE